MAWQVIVTEVNVSIAEVNGSVQCRRKGNGKSEFCCCIKLYSTVTYIFLCFSKQIVGARTGWKGPTVRTGVFYVLYNTTRPFFVTTHYMHAETQREK